MEALVTANVLSVFILVLYNIYKLDKIADNSLQCGCLNTYESLVKLAIANIVYLAVFTISVMVSLALLRSL